MITAKEVKELYKRYRQELIALQQEKAQLRDEKERWKKELTFTAILLKVQRPVTNDNTFAINVQFLPDYLLEGPRFASGLHDPGRLIRVICEETCEKMFLKIMELYKMGEFK